MLPPFLDCGICRKDINRGDEIEISEIADVLLFNVCSKCKSPLDLPSEGIYVRDKFDTDVVELYHVIQLRFPTECGACGNKIKYLYLTCEKFNKLKFKQMRNSYVKLTEDSPSYNSMIPIGTN